MQVEKLPLDAIRAQVENCQACALCETRTNIVFGDGDPHARVLIVGEAPGKNEDLQGKPFVGAAGKFLDELLEEAGLKREEVFIANVLKCRPPSNRNPQADEIEACAPFLREQTQSIDPWIIVTMGNFATQFILRTGTGITPCWQRTYPRPSASGDTTTSSTPRLSTQTAVLTISIMESIAPTS